MIGIHSTAAANNQPVLKTKRGLSFKSSALFPKKNAIPSGISVDSADYIKYVYNLVRKWCKLPIERNVESGRLDDIVKSKEACIFIMNHTKNQPMDFDSAKFFNTLLYREYIYNGLSATCPRSKVLTNSNLLEGESGEKFKWLGLVPVNAGISGNGKAENAVTIKKLITDLAESKINLFIFPEGALGIFSFLPLSYKFQPGVSSIVKKVLDIKNKIKVVPLGFAHRHHDSAIHIGAPVRFYKNEKGYIAGRGNADSDFFEPKLKDFYKAEESAVLTQNGTPIADRGVIPLISGILMANLTSCSKEAERDLLNSDKKVYTI